MEQDPMDHGDMDMGGNQCSMNVRLMLNAKLRNGAHLRVDAIYMVF